MDQPRRALPQASRTKVAASSTFAEWSDSDYELCALRLKALADPGRLRIVHHLLRGSKNVSDLANELEMEMVNVSHHLQVLRHANLLHSHKRGKYVIYSVRPEIFSIHHDIAGSSTARHARSLDLGYCRLQLFR